METYFLLPIPLCLDAVDASAKTASAAYPASRSLAATIDLRRRGIEQRSAIGGGHAEQPVNLLFCETCAKSGIYSTSRESLFTRRAVARDGEGHASAANWPTIHAAFCPFGSPD